MALRRFCLSDELRLLVTSMKLFGQSPHGCLPVCTAPVSFTGPDVRRRQDSNLRGLASASFDHNSPANRQAIAIRHVLSMSSLTLSILKYIFGYVSFNLQSK
jgi:hypothetical protein